MTAINNEAVYDQIHGIQLAIFEIIWPLPWLSGIYLNSSLAVCTVFAKTNAEPTEEQWDDFIAVMDEILRPAFKRSKVQYKLCHGEILPVDQEFDQIMGPEIFTAIAKEHAPWRLE